MRSGFDSQPLGVIRLSTSRLTLRHQFFLNGGLFAAHLFCTAFAAWLFSASLTAQFWPIWPAAGISAYGLLVWGPRVIPGLLLATIFGNYIFTNQLLPINLWFSVIDILSIWFGSILLRRFSPHWTGFRTVHDTLAYLLLFTAPSAFLGAILTIAGGLLLTPAHGSIFHLILFWGMAKAAALINVTILLLVFLRTRDSSKIQISSGYLLSALTVLTMIACLFFLPYPSESLTEGATFLLILPFLWMLTRYPIRLVYPLAAISFFLALLGTSLGYGPYQHSQTLFPETMVQLIGILLEVIGLIASAMIQERHDALNALKDANQILEQRVADRSADLLSRNHELQVRDAFLESVTTVNRLFHSTKQLASADVLNRFCEILVEKMNLAAVWVGHVEIGSEHIEIMAKAGPLSRPLTELQLYCQPEQGQSQSPSGRAISEQRTLFFEGDNPLFAPCKDIVQSYHLGGSIHTPFIWPDSSRGVVTLYRYEGTVFPLAIIDLLERLCEDLAAFLRQEQLSKELDDARTLQKTMLVGGDIVLQARDASSMLQQICDELIRSGLFNAAFIIRPNAEGVFEALAVAGDHVEWILQRRWTIHEDDFPDGQSLTSQAWRQGRHLIIQDYLSALGSKADWYAEANAHNWRAVASIPIHHLQERWAMLNIIGSRVNMFNAEIFDVLQRIAQLLGRGLDEIHLKTELQKQRQRQSYLAQHDALTGLANRRGFTEFLSSAMAEARQQGKLLAVAMLDLDDFKPVNDQHGHGAGDLLLKEIASRLRQALRQSDYLARLGGDEFVLVWNHLQNPEQIAPILEKIGAYLAKPYFLDASLPTIRVGISAGITFYPHQDDDSDPDLLLREADHALYEAKQDKSRRLQFWRFFEGAKTSKQKHIQKLLRDGRMVLQYQPVLDLRNNQVVGVEALARLDSMQEAIPPGDFLPFLAPEDQWRLTELVLNQIAIDWREWQTQGIHLWVSLNILPRFLTNPVALERLQHLLESCPVPPTNLILEILESEELRSLEYCAESIRILQKKGYRIGLDDVGTGYASLLYLKELPVDEIKIDQAFVRHIGRNPNDLHFLRAMLDLGISQKVEVIVEGVESSSIFRILRRMRAPMLQGFAVALPMWPKDLINWLLTYDSSALSKNNENFDLLQLYTETIDYQKLVFHLLSFDIVNFMKTGSWTYSQCPITRRIQEVSGNEKVKIQTAHQEYHLELEKLTAEIYSGKTIDTTELHNRGRTVLQQISLAISDQSLPETK